MGYLPFQSQVYHSESMNLPALDIMKAIEVLGTVDSRGNLALDQPLAVHNQRVRVIVLLSGEDTDPDDEMLEPAIEGFRQGWRDAMTGNTIPVEQLWEGIDAD
jgi:hypothetical protein